MIGRFFSWLRSLLPARTRGDVYRPRERLIYSYWDGAKVVRADPMVLYQRVMERGPELSIDIKVATSPSKGAAAAQSGAVDKIRTAFGLKPFDGENGLTELEVFALLDHFLEFAEGLKKNSSPTVTSAAGTSATTPPSSAAAPPTPSTSASGSTAAGPPTGPPTPTTGAVPSPSGPPNPV